MPSSTKPKSGKVTLYLDSRLWENFQTFCDRNPRVKSPSAEVGKAMLRMIQTKGKKFGVRPPEHLIPA